MNTKSIENVENIVQSKRKKSNINSVCVGNVDVWMVNDIKYMSHIDFVSAE